MQASSEEEYSTHGVIFLAACPAPTTLFYYYRKYVYFLTNLKEYMSHCCSSIVLDILVGAIQVCRRHGD